MGLHTLEFDGSEDSICHPYDLEGRRHMEYVNFHGEFDEFPQATTCCRPLPSTIRTCRGSTSRADLAQPAFPPSIVLHSVVVLVLPLRASQVELLYVRIAGE